MDSKSSQWRPGPTVCRCCLSEGCYKDISTEYFWMGKREVYEELLLETLDLSIEFSKSGGPNSNSRLICEPCISRLRDASEFKKQVIQCEKTFLQHIDGRNPIEIHIQEVSETGGNVKLEGEVKVESRLSDDDFDDRNEFALEEDDDDADDQPLTKLATKQPKDENVDLLDLIDNAKVAEKRKSATKLKGAATKKTKVSKDNAEPSVSGAKTAEPRIKKKKDIAATPGWITSKNNCKNVLLYSTVYPFRMKGSCYICVYCLDTFKDPTDFREHQNSEHSTFNVDNIISTIPKSSIKIDCSNIRCKVCNLKIETYDLLLKHLSHHGLVDLNADAALIPFKLQTNSLCCYICNKKILGITQLIVHTHTHFSKHICHVCGKKFSTESGFNTHSIKHKITLPFLCRKCKMQFATTQELKVHRREVKACQPFGCNLCKERFLHNEAVNRHKVSVHGLPKTSYPCPECSNVYESRTIRYLHYKVEHTDEYYKCEDCNKKLATKGEYDKHRVIHTGDRPFKCPICEKTFGVRKHMTRHMRIHEPVKRFACSVCSKGFCEKAKLRLHMKTHRLDNP